MIPAASIGRLTAEAVADLEPELRPMVGPFIDQMTVAGFEDAEIAAAVGREWERLATRAAEAEANAPPDAAAALLRSTEPEAPRPLRRELPPAAKYPVAALGPLAPAARAIQERTQAPVSICAQAALAAAALAVQRLRDVELPTGRSRPTSLFLLTSADSGERKTSADDLACDAIRQREAELAAGYGAERLRYDAALSAWERQKVEELKIAGMAAKQAALEALGEKPAPPVPPALTCENPTVEGLQRLYTEGAMALGIFSSEGGQFLGGYGMSAEHRLSTAAALSHWWDGTPMKRVRRSDGTTRLAGRRLCTHLAMQPGVAAGMLADAALLDQGLLSRFLLVAPEPAAGTRLWRESSAGSGDDLAAFGERLLELLRQDADGDATNGLRPPALRLEAEARQLFIGYHDAVEASLKLDGELHAIKALGAKLPEHSARIAAVLTVFENATTRSVSGEAMAGGIALAEHYASEALRLFEAAAEDRDLLLAERVLTWLRAWLPAQEPPRPAFSLVPIYQLGPRPVRNARTARRVVGILVEHGWLRPVEGGTVEDGNRRAEAWELVS